MIFKWLLWVSLILEVSHIPVNYVTCSTIGWFQVTENKWTKERRGFLISFLRWDLFSTAYFLRLLFFPQCLPHSYHCLLCSRISSMVKAQAPRLWLTSMLNTDCTTVDAMIVCLLMIARISWAKNRGFDDVSLDLQGWCQRSVWS